MSGTIYVISIDGKGRKYIPRLTEEHYAYAPTFKTRSECQEVCDRLNRKEVGLAEVTHQK
jgi:hypothetical protein